MSRLIVGALISLTGHMAFAFELPTTCFNPSYGRLDVGSYRLDVRGLDKISSGEWEKMERNLEHVNDTRTEVRSVLDCRLPSNRNFLSLLECTSLPGQSQKYRVFVGIHVGGPYALIYKGENLTEPEAILSCHTEN